MLGPSHSSSIKSEEFIKGYNACAVGISRPHNPYLAGQPWLWEFPPKNWKQNSDDWHDGWNTRFYGEKIYEGEPDP